MNELTHGNAVFIPYVLCEVPSNILLKKFKRPSAYLGILVTCWGIIMTCTGLVQNFGGLMATRLLLGIFESVPERQSLPIDLPR